MSNPLAVLSDEAAEGAVNHMAELERENATLRKAVLSLDGDKRNLQHALLRMKQRYDDQLAQMQEQLNAMAFRLEDMTVWRDQSVAPLLIAVQGDAETLKERVDGLCSRESL